MASPEKRVFVDGIPFLMNEQWLRCHVEACGLARPTKVTISRSGWHQSGHQYTQAFLWYESTSQAESVAHALNGTKLPGWWRPLKCQLARTDPRPLVLQFCCACVQVLGLNVVTYPGNPRYQGHQAPDSWYDDHWWQKTLGWVASSCWPAAIQVLVLDCQGHGTGGMKLQTGMTMIAGQGHVFGVAFACWFGKATIQSYSVYGTAKDMGLGAWSSTRNPSNCNPGTSRVFSLVLFCLIWYKSKLPDILEVQFSHPQSFVLELLLKTPCLIIRGSCIQQKWFIS